MQKRVLFHAGYSGAGVEVMPGFEIAFHPLASAAGEPVEFAASHPPGRDLNDGMAARKVPQRVDIDFRNGAWQGQIHY